MKQMPRKLAFHCAISFANDSKIFIHGGMTSDKEFNNYTFEFDIVSQTLSKTVKDCSFRRITMWSWNTF